MLNSNLPNIRVKYVTAAYCGACKVYGPVIEKATQDLGLPFEKLDAEDDCRKVASLNVSSLPTTIVYTNGQESRRWEGAYSPKKTAEMLASHSLFAPTSPRHESTVI